MSLKTIFFNIMLYPFLLVRRLLNGVRALFDREDKNLLVDLSQQLTQADNQIDAMTDSLLEEKQLRALLEGSLNYLVKEHQEQTKQLAEATFQLHKITKERSNLLNQVAELVERNNKEYDELFGAREDLAAEREKNIKLKKKLKKFKG